MELIISGNDDIGYTAKGSHQSAVDQALAPCPFCHGHLLSVCNKSTSPYYEVTCNSCDAQGPTKGPSPGPGLSAYPSRADAQAAHQDAFRAAVAAWNKTAIAARPDLACKIPGQQSEEGNSVLTDILHHITRPGALSYERLQAISACLKQTPDVQQNLAQSAAALREAGDEVPADMPGATYIVIKPRDAYSFLTPSDWKRLTDMQDKIAAGRRAKGLPPLHVAVIESDWPEYEPVWAMLEARVASGINYLSITDNLAPDFQHGSGENAAATAESAAYLRLAPKLKAAIQAGAMDEAHCIASAYTLCGDIRDALRTRADAYRQIAGASVGTPPDSRPVPPPSHVGQGDQTSHGLHQVIQDPHQHPDAA